MELKAYEEKYRQQMIDVWERSALATHHFVSKEDFVRLKELVKELDFTALKVFCMMDESRVVGFIGVEGQVIEALFLDPDYIGKGIGARLMRFALDELHADQVTVNEQNTNAIAFYTKFGFTPYERIEKSPEGMDYPILKMKLLTTD